MAITHSFDNAFTITDYTEELMLIPNMWNLVEREGIFKSSGVGTNVAAFDKTEQTAQLIGDKPYGERSTFGGNEQSALFSYAIPTFPIDDFVTVGDVYGLRRIGTADQREIVDDVVFRKATQLRRSHALTAEYARCQAIQGIVYAPNSTVVATNWYTEFGQTQTVVNFNFTDTGLDQRDNVQQVVAHIQDSFRGAGVLEQVVFFCTPGFFSALISNAQIEAAYTYYSSTQEPLRTGLRGTGSDAVYRRFVWQDVLFIEYRGQIDNADGTSTPMFPEGTGGQAWAVPRGSDAFHTYYAPAYRLDEIGSQGAESYMWTWDDPKESKITIQSESNFLSVSKRPELVVKCTNISS